MVGSAGDCHGGESPAGAPEITSDPVLGSTASWAALTVGSVRIQAGPTCSAVIGVSGSVDTDSANFAGRGSGLTVSGGSVGAGVGAGTLGGSGGVAGEETGSAGVGSDVISLGIFGVGGSGGASGGSIGSVFAGSTGVSLRLAASGSPPCTGGGGVVGFGGCGIAPVGSTGCGGDS